MGSAASAGVSTVPAGDAKSEAEIQERKQFLTFNSEEREGPKPKTGAWGEETSPEHRRKGSASVDGPQLFKEALDDDGELVDAMKKTRVSPKPKRPLDKTAGSPKRINQKNTPTSGGSKPTRFKDMEGGNVSESDPDAADAVAMAEAAEARRRAKKKAAKKEKKLREEREAHARAEAARFAEEERARAEEYKKNKAKIDDKWDAITSPSGSAATSPKINVNPKNATSPRPKRQLNPQAIKRRLSSSSVNQEEDAEEGGGSSSGVDRTESKTNAGRARGPQNNTNDDDTAAIADELLAETSAFRTHEKAYRPPADVNLPTYSNFDNEKFRKMQSMKAESPSGGGGSGTADAPTTHVRKKSEFVGLGRFRGTGPDARPSGSNNRNPAGPSADSDEEGEDDDEDLMDQILNDAADDF